MNYRANYERKSFSQFSKFTPHFWTSWWRCWCCWWWCHDMVWEIIWKLDKMFIDDIMNCYHFKWIIQRATTIPQHCARTFCFLVCPWVPIIIHPLLLLGKSITDRLFTNTYLCKSVKVEILYRWIFTINKWGKELMKNFHSALYQVKIKSFVDQRVDMPFLVYSWYCTWWQLIYLIIC